MNNNNNNNYQQQDEDLDYPSAEQPAAPIATVASSDQLYNDEEKLPLQQHFTSETIENKRPFIQVIQDAIGWLSFSIVFNLLNTIVYSALFPKILEGVTSDKNLSLIHI